MPDKKDKTSLILNPDDMLFWKDTGANREYALRIQSDDEPLNPRKDCDNPDIMACFHSRHTWLGDDITAKTPGEFWSDLIKNEMTQKEIASSLLAIDKNAHHYDSDILTKCLSAIVSGKELDDNMLSELAEDFLEYVQDEDATALAVLVSKSHIASLPLWLYDHSGLTISCGTRTYPYNDRWDSSAIGWIVIPKSEALKNLCAVRTDKNSPAKMCDDSNWEQSAYACMESSVRQYDQYLTGDVYGYTLYTRPLDTAGKDDSKTTEDQWEETDSCWGFFGSDVNESGLLDNVSSDSLMAAIQSGDYKTGRATSHSVTITTWTFHKHDA